MLTGFIKYSVLGSVLSSLLFISSSTFADVVAINIAAPSLANAKLAIPIIIIPTITDTTQLPFILNYPLRHRIN